MNLSNQKNQISSINILKKIFNFLDNKRKRELKLVSFFSVLSSLAESISVALLIPFISFFIKPETYVFNNFFNFIFEFLQINTKEDILISVTIFFVLMIIVSGIIRVFYIRFSNKVTDRITSDFRIKIFNFLVSQEYSYYFKHGSQEIMSNITQKTDSFSGVVFNSINIFNAVLTSLAIVIVLTINEPVYTPIIILTILIFFYLVYKVKSSFVFHKGQNLNIYQNNIIDIFDNAVGYLPEIIIYNLRSFFSQLFIKTSEGIAKSSSEIRTIGQTPRIYLETFSLTFIVLLIFFSNFSNKVIEDNIAYLALLAFGAQKTLPLVNSIYNLSINLKSSIPIVSSFLKILENDTSIKQIEDENLQYKKINFDKQLEIKNLSFRYNQDSPKILENFSLIIKKGQKTAIKGKTGSGKSTLANLISGLLVQDEGKLIVDGIEINKDNIQNWQKNISVVPQYVFLNDSTILENIAIGFDHNKIDFKRVKESAKIAQISDYIENLPNQYQERVGEKGIRLSGGQRQRIGIARAIYRGANLIILDEPTNALDAETEKLVLESISNLGEKVTLIVISHSNNLLDYFDQIIDLDLY